MLHRKRSSPYFDIAGRRQSVSVRRVPSNRVSAYLNAGLYTDDGVALLSGNSMACPATASIRSTANPQPHVHLNSQSCVPRRSIDHEMADRRDPAP